MSRVFITCHNPERHGELTWEGHEIVGYVDLTDGGQPSVGRYYKGWDSIPADLQGTIDIVLSMFCPVAGDLRKGLKTVDLYPLPGGIQGGKDVNEIFVKAFALLKPGGKMMFPAPDAIADTSKEVLEWKLPPPPAGQDRNAVKNTVEFVDIGDVRPYRPGAEGLLARRPWLVVTKPAAGGRRRRRRKTVRRIRGGRQPRVLVACHIPSRHGKVTWEGHQIVGYVDVNDGAAVAGDAPYYQGWDSIPAELRGTIDIILSIGCPVATGLTSGHFRWESPAEEDIGVYGASVHEILTKGLRLLRPDGTFLFPRLPDVHAATKTVLRTHGLVVETIANIPKPRWLVHRHDDEYDVNDAHSRDVLRGVQMTRVAGGRRRRYPRSSLRKSIRS